jgi:hypothetical protein
MPGPIAVADPDPSGRPLAQAGHIAQKFSRVCASKAVFVLANKLNFYAFMSQAEHFQAPARIQPCPCSIIKHAMRQEA